MDMKYCHQRTLVTTTKYGIFTQHLFGGYKHILVSGCMSIEIVSKEEKGRIFSSDCIYLHQKFHQIIT